MAAIIDPLLMAGIVFSLGVAVTSLLPSAGREADGMDDRMIFRLLLGPLCLATLILIVDGVAGHLYLVR
jgi:hypothetical protein